MRLRLTSFLAALATCWAVLPALAQTTAVDHAGHLADVPRAARGEAVQVVLSENRLLLRSDGAMYVVSGTARHAVAPLVMADDEINALPESSPFTGGLMAADAGTGGAGAPAQDLREHRVVLRSDNAVFVIQDTARHAVTPLQATDDEINALPEGDPYVGGVVAFDPSHAAVTRSAATAPVGPVVKVTISDGRIVADPSSVPAGSITFMVTATGKIDHELQVIRSDLDPKALPHSKVHGEIDEAAVGDKAGEIEGILPGTTETDTFDMTPGRYVLFCNVSGHYDKGEVTTLDVK